MKQILQNLSDGSTYIQEAPLPQMPPGTLLIRSRASLISSGTERMLVSFGRGSLLDKARQQPDRVRQVIDKVRTDGLLTTLDAVRGKLNEPISLGYCNVGDVVGIGEGVEGFHIGARVASNGPHADFVVVPKNLCALVPTGVDDESAVFTVPASIALQGIRLAAPTLGENFVVIGAGLIGNMAIQLLRANGCRVLAIDPDEMRLSIAEACGAEICRSSDEVLDAANIFSRGAGVDGVIVTASTDSSAPISSAAKMCRKRGRVILVGTTGLELNRADFYEKELTFQVSCSYGPGRYDPDYEIKGHDYPTEFVRWTEQRNFGAVLDLVATNSLNFKPLITHRIAFHEAPKAYEILLKDAAALGIVLTYSMEPAKSDVSVLTLRTAEPAAAAQPVVGLIGSGNYASRILIPALRAADARRHTIVSVRGVSASVQGLRGGFERAATDVAAVLETPEINAVFVATRHDSHAKIAAAALRAGKNIFVEKPLSIDRQGLADVQSAYESAEQTQAAPRLMVGFNRRFSPFVVKAKSLLSTAPGPKSVIVTVNAGMLPADSWQQDSAIGGGRIVGEACHFIDLLRFLVGAPITAVDARAVNPMRGPLEPDSASITLGFSDGSVGTVHYFSQGSSRFPKERIEIFGGGKTIVIDNFRKLLVYGSQPLVQMRRFRQDKGQFACTKVFLDAVQFGTPSPIASDEVFEVARVTIEAVELLRER